MRKHVISDQELVRRYIKGDESAFETLILRHKQRIYTYVYMMVKDEQLAEDVFQDTFIKVIRTLKSGKYNEEGKFLPWVMRIAHNLVIDYFRKSRKMPTVSGGGPDSDFDIFSVIKRSDPNVEDDLIQDKIFSDVRELVDRLPEEQREVVKMRHFMGMSFKDIADSSDVSINTALGRMRYALINLRKMIEDHQVSLTRS